MRESPVHVREYLRAEAVFATLETIDPTRRIDVEALLDAAADTVVEFPSVEAGVRGKASASPRRRRGLWQWAAAATVILTVVAGVWYSTLPQAGIYTTGLGEQRRLVLGDGSVIDMNTQSKLTVRLSEKLRSIDLIEGEALFTVARDTERPFVVASEHATVRALGTQFNVHKRDGEVLVTVLEGRVAVERKRAANQSGAVGSLAAGPVELGAGDAAEVLPAAPIRTQAKVNTEQTVAWTERRLIFENEPLFAVVAEFNRYNPRQLVIEDDALGEERISAVFDADKPDALVRFLEQNAGIVVHESQTQLILRTRE